MNNIRIRYSSRMTVNIGNFQNLQPEYEMTADLEPGENPDEAFAKIKRKVDALLEEDVMDILSEKNG